MLCDYIVKVSPAWVGRWSRRVAGRGESLGLSRMRGLTLIEAGALMPAPISLACNLAGR